MPSDAPAAAKGAWEGLVRLLLLLLLPLLLLLAMLLLQLQLVADFMLVPAAAADRAQERWDDALRCARWQLISHTSLQRLPAAR
jgi:hypothetical protein